MTKMKKPLLLNALMLACLASAAGSSSEYFVSRTGDDSASGASQAQAFRTVQRGLDALSSGDILTIGPGEYAGPVSRKDLGNLGHETLIKAAIPGTVLLRGDAPLPELEKVDGYRFVYSAALAKKPIAVMEVDTLQNLMERFGKSELEYQPGTWFYDKEKEQLYLSSFDLAVPYAKRYRQSITPVSGMILENPKRVVVEGLAFTGFYPEDKKKPPNTNYVGGLMLIEPIQCIVRECFPFLNGQGICLVGGTGNVIEQCTAYGNGSPYHDQGGNIVRYLGNNDIIRFNLSYASAAESIKFYSGISGPVSLYANISWGAWADYYIKGGEAQKYGLAEKNIGLSSSSVHNVERNLLGSINQYNLAMSSDNVILAGLDREKEFADFLNLDFRLQKNSTLRGAGPNGTDRGPFPYAANIFYISSEGEDSNDGLSASTAWKTPARALGQLKAGDTLYFSAGTYELPSACVLNAKGAAPIRILGRGTGDVVIKGVVGIDARGPVEVERLGFLDTVSATGAIRFKNCRFFGSKTGLLLSKPDSASLTRCEFAKFSQAGLKIDGKNKPSLPQDGVFLSGNIFDNAVAPAVSVPSLAFILYSDYNSYASRGACWQVNGQKLKFADLQKSHDTYSHIIDPAYRAEERSFVLKNPGDFLALGPLGKPLGNYPTLPTRAARLVGPFVHSVTESTANLEWWTAQMARCEVSWGDSEDSMQSRWLFTRGYGSVSLTDLKPGTKYTFKILQVDPSVNPLPFRNFYRTEFAENMIGSSKFIYERPVRPESAVTSFETLAVAPASRVYFVTTDGNDTSSGLTREQAWKSINYAASKVVAGDTVQIGAGTYQETVWVRAGGDEKKPIVFRPIRGERVTLDGSNGRLNNAFVLRGKNYVTIDGIKFQGFGFGRDVTPSSIELYESNNINISRCLMDGRRILYTAPFVEAWACKNLTLTNCVVIQAMNQGIALFRCPDATIQNCVFFRNYTGIAVLVNKTDEKGRFVSNILTDLTVGKEKIPMLEIPEIEAFTQENNVFVLRSPGAERAPIFNFYRSAGLLRLSDYIAQRGASGSVELDPQFQGNNRINPNPAAAFPPDNLIRKPELDFDDFFVGDESLIKKGVGLQPAVFSEFNFSSKNQ